MFHKIKKLYQLYLMPILISIYFKLSCTPVFAAGITAQDVGKKGAAQYNQLMEIDKKVFGISFGACALLATFVGIIIAYDTSKSFTMGDFNGFWHGLNNLGKIMFGAAAVAASFAIVSGVALFLASVRPPTAK